MIPPGKTWKDTAANTFIMSIAMAPWVLFFLKCQGCFDG